MTEAPIPQQVDSQIPDELTQYLRHGSYEKVGIFPTNELMVAAFAPVTVPILIGVDGPSTGGKTSVTESLTAFYDAQGIAVSVLPVDFFLTNRDVRTRLNTQIRAGEMDVNDYSLEAWDHERYHTFLETAKEIAMRTSGTPECLVVPNAYNRETGLQDHTELVTIRPGSVLIAEGTGIHAIHDDILDFTVRVDVHDVGTLLDRVVKREEKKPVGKRLDTDFLLERYKTTDVPHTNFLRRASAGRADVVVDTSNLTRLTVYKNHLSRRR